MVEIYSKRFSIQYVSIAIKPIESELKGFLITIENHFIVALESVCPLKTKENSNGTPKQLVLR